MSNVAIMNVATLMKSNQAKLTFSKDTKMEDRNQFKATLSTITQQQNEQRKSVREKSQNVEPGTKEVKKNERSANYLS